MKIQKIQSQVFFKNLPGLTILFLFFLCLMGLGVFDYLGLSILIPIISQVASGQVGDISFKVPGLSISFGEDLRLYVVITALIFTVRLILAIVFSWFSAQISESFHLSVRSNIIRDV